MSADIALDIAYTGTAGVERTKFDQTGQIADADYLGLLLMAKAGYDPREAVGVLRRMGEQPAAGGVETDGNYSARMKQVEGWMDEALANYNPPPGFEVGDLPTASTP